MFQVGDTVKFTGGGRYAPESFYSEKHPHRKDGSIVLGEHYKKNFAKIVGTYNGYFLVEWVNENDSVMCLAFGDKYLELVKPAMSFIQQYRIKETNHLL